MSNIKVITAETIDLLKNAEQINDELWKNHQPGSLGYLKHQSIAEKLDEALILLGHK